MKRILIVSAMAEETAALVHRLPSANTTGVSPVVALIGIGKVAAAANTQKLIDQHRPDAALLVGVAGALQPHLSLGAVGLVVGAIDADMDVRAWRPGYSRGEHPLTRDRIYLSDTSLVRRARRQSRCPVFPAFVATGSAFLDEPGKAQFRREVLPALTASVDGEIREPDLIDMETSAFLQVAQAARVPALALRTVSDTLEGDAAGDFEAFLNRASDSYAEILQHLLLTWHEPDEKVVRA